MTNSKKEIYIQKIDNGRSDSFWYKGEGKIVKFSKGDREVIVSSCGLIRVKFQHEDFYRKNEQVVDAALRNS